MDKTQRIRHRYNRIAPVYDLLDASMEWRLFRKQRHALLAPLKGRVLEVGIGTGKNLRHYPPGVELVAIDFSGGMLKRARRRASKLGRTVDLVEMDAQAMTFADNSFDAVVTACVFCSVPDPVKGLKEIRRVCKPGGQVMMLEHVRSEKPLIGWLVDRLNFVPVRLYGANINRRTLENLTLAGFDHLDVEDVWLDIFKRIRATNLKPTRLGIATPRHTEAD